ncbi:hypothetical protein K490DRAFT_70774 [Saccharata proteae CBS 121410]|uniref:Chalcone isomerase domain-containing protein n=1 Tax=Saccharata proteae CBS 121410 TaxID=1314787 RepID=A0A9P4I311_9PEZI|nr:hypothetical protein K490DRAFT_70774 [Saccharata proteae CBS 121410]
MASRNAATRLATRLRAPHCLYRPQRLFPKTPAANDFLPRNPLDRIAAHRAETAYLAWRKRRIRLASFGLAFCIAAQIFLCYLVDLKTRDPELMDASGDADRQFRGREVVVLPGREKTVARAEDGEGEEIEVVETGTSSVPVFPKTIRLPTGGSGSSGNATDAEYTLVGLGIRTVSFLSIQVYVVGLYVQTTSLPTLQASLIHRINPTASTLIAGEKDELRTALLDPQRSNELWDSLLRDPTFAVNSAFRIVPTRDTNFAHLRDGMVNGITKRTSEAAAAGSTEYQDETFGLAMKEFKNMFNGKGKAPKGSTVVFLKDQRGALEMLFAGKDGEGKVESLGRVEDERMGRLMWLLYLGGKNVSSEGARKSVVNGCVELVERPIGTVETRVE